MLNRDKDLLSILINDERINVVHSRGKNDGLHLINFFSESVEGANSGEWADKIRSAVSGFSIRKARAVLAIPSNIVTTKNIEIPSLDEEEIRSIIDLQAGRHTPYTREEILIGYVSIGVFQRNYTKVLLVIANRDAIKSRLDSCEDAGVRVERVIFAPEALSFFYARALGLTSKDDPVGIIDVGFSTTEFVFEYNQTVSACRNIPIGLKHINEKGSEARERLVNELLQSVEIYRNEDINKIPSRYIFTSDQSGVSDLPGILRDKLKADVSVLSFQQKIKTTEKAKEFLSLNQSESLANPAAALYLFSEDCKIDLMPEEVRNQRTIEEQGKQVVMTGIFSVILLILVCGIFFIKIYFQNLYLEKLKREHLVKQYLVVKLDKIGHRTRIIKDYTATRMVSLEVLKELYTLIPENIYLQTIVLDEQGMINIQGISESMSTVFNVVKALEDSSLFKGVKTRSTTAKKDRGKDVAAFDIIFGLESNPDAPSGGEAGGLIEEQKVN